MTGVQSQFWQGLAFTAGAVGFVAVTAWWLFFSPLRRGVPVAIRPSPRLSAVLAAFMGLWALQLIVGALWDASMHIQTGEIPAGADFLWPPHLMIYSAFLFSLAVTLIAVGWVGVAGWRAGQRDPRQCVRSNPCLGALGLASTYSLLSIPGDALWHELFGVDLTAWSPPHVMLGVTGATVLICAIGLLGQARTGPGSAWSEIAFVFLLGLLLNVAYIIGVIEWELPGGRNPAVEARPLWAYPLVGGALALFTFALARRVVRLRWPATASAAAFYVVRLGISAGLALTDNIAPLAPLWFILGAIGMDAIPWERIASRPLRDLATSAAFTAGFALTAMPLLSLRPDLRAFSVPYVLAFLAAMQAAGLVLLPIGRLAGRRLSAAVCEAPSVTDGPRSGLTNASSGP